MPEEKFKHEENIEIDRQLLRSESNDSLIPAPKGWLLYSGISVITFGLILGLLVSYIIEYPDVIRARGEITTMVPPLDHYPKLSSRISTIFKLDGDTVTFGERLFLMESDADYKDMDQLKDIIKPMIGINDDTLYLDKYFPVGLNLGTLQDSYENCTKLLEDLKYFISEDLSAVKLKSLENDILYLKKLIASQSRELILFRKELDLVVRQSQRQVWLESEGVISKREMEQDSQKTLQTERSKEGMNANIIRLQSQLISLEKQKYELVFDKRTGIHDRIIAFKGAVVNLVTKLKEWRSMYEISAGMSGVLHFENPVFPNQQVLTADKICSVIPIQDPNPIIVRCKLAGLAYGKIAKGQKVIVEIDDYPVSEYGRIIGTVSKISKMSTKDKDDQNNYLVEILIGQKLITDYNKNIEWRQRMQANVKIITKSRRLLERFFENIYELLTRIK